VLSYLTIYALEPHNIRYGRWELPQSIPSE
jgi:hypothetical protein